MLTFVVTIPSFGLIATSSDVAELEQLALVMPPIDVLRYVVRELVVE